jgi:hypothetical protein
MQTISGAQIKEETKCQLGKKRGANRLRRDEPNHINGRADQPAQTMETNE